MDKVRNIIAGAFAAAGLAFAAPAAAEPILLDGSDIGDSYTITFDGFVDNGPSIDGLSGSLMLTLTSIVDGVYSFDYAMTNTGETGDGISSRISSFAFNTDPEIDSASASGDFGFALVDGRYPNGIGSVDVCFRGQNTGSCSGGGSAGVFDGETGTGTLSLDFGSGISAISLSDFFIRYQSVDGIYGVGSASGRQTSSTSGGTDVPAPGMLLIFALAMLALMGKTLRSGFPLRAPRRHAHT